MNWRVLLDQIAASKLTLLFVLTLILCWPLFYNGYPLLYSDSGTYIVSSIELKPPVDRPIGYGLFINWITWKATLYTVPLFQNLILSFLIVRCCELFKLKKIIILFITIILSLITGISWYSNQIMPDIFTSILFLSSLLYLTDEKASRFEKTLSLLFIFVALISHFSNLVILIITLTLLFIIGFKSILLANKNKFKKLVAVITIAPLFLAFNHWKNDFGFVVSRSNNVFLTARLAETGILKKILDKKCIKKNYSLCACKDSLPNATAPFLWDYQNSPLYTKSGGWEKANVEYADFVKQIYSDKEIFFLFIKASFTATWQQLFEVNIGSGLSAYGENSAPFYPISAHLKKEYPNYINAKQQQSQFNFELLNSINKVVLVFSFTTLLFLFFVFKNDKRVLFFLTAVFIICISNAAVTASLANVYDRLQARVLWLPVFFVLVFITVLIQKKLLERNSTSS
ncbi:MAG: hypothetical protein V4667_03225 [Bacteroidota bacterium]